MSTLVKLSQMVDLAVGSPEPGALNLNILHSVLHVMIRQMQIDDTQVEFRGPDSDRMETCLAAASHFPQVRLSEYVLHEGEREGTPADNRNQGEKDDDSEKGDTSSEKGEKSDQKAAKAPKKAVPGKKAVGAASSKASATTVVVVQNAYDSDTDSNHPRTPKPDTAGSRSSPTKVLEKKIMKLQSDLEALANYQPPANQEMLGSARHGTDQKPVGEMWEMMKFAKRMDAAEQGMTKLASLVEDVAKGVGVDDGAGGGRKKAPATPASEWVRPDRGEEEEGGMNLKRVDSIERRLWNIENRVGVAERRLSSVAGGLNINAKSSHDLPGDKSGSTAGNSSTGGGSGGHGGGGGGINLDNMTPEQATLALRDELAKMRRDLDKQHDATKDMLKLAKKIPFATLMEGVKHIEELRKKVGEFMTNIGDDPANIVSLKEHEELASQVNQSALQLENMDSSVNNQIDRFQEQLTNLEKEMGALVERVNAGLPAAGDAGAPASDFGDYNELFGKIANMEANMEVVNRKTTSITDEKDEREMHIKALIEQIELLKTVKADKEDLDEALAEKADQATMNRKVSHDQFDTACDDLSKGLEEALMKLTQQEVLWSDALDDVQRMVENKLDKIEISPLKDFVNSKLKLLQERLKTLAALRKETEAAGTKQKMLRNVNCLSCDKDVIQRMDEKGRMVPTEALPPNRSMRPYLAYELDAVRRQQRRLPGARNMNHFESAMHEQQARGRCRDLDHMGKQADHLCNRYCGGSHTMTTPQQRVTRTGHFLNQFGPEVIALHVGPPRSTVGADSPRTSVVADPAAAPSEPPPARYSVSGRRESGRKPSASTAAAPVKDGTPPKPVTPPPASPPQSQLKSPPTTPPPPPSTPPPTAESQPDTVQQSGSKSSAGAGVRKTSSPTKAERRTSGGERRASDESKSGGERRTSAGRRASLTSKGDRRASGGGERKTSADKTERRVSGEEEAKKAAAEEVPEPAPTTPTTPLLTPAASEAGAEGEASRAEEVAAVASPAPVSGAGSGAEVAEGQPETGLASVEEEAVQPQEGQGE